MPIALRGEKNSLNLSGTECGSYYLIEQIANSVMSQVYLARMKVSDSSNRIVIFKTLHPRSMNDRRSRSLFLKELETSAALSHPNIVQLYDFGEINGQPFTVMEWIHGKNIKELGAAFFKKNGIPLFYPASATIIFEISKALYYAHTFENKITGDASYVVHCDITPHNIMVSYDGAVKLIDFGIAKMATQNNDTLSDVLMGKISYLSPEQCLGQEADSRSDLFSLGLVFYELLSGKRLFSADNDLVVLERIKNSEHYVKAALQQLHQVPPALLEILKKCLNHDRDNRFSSTLDLCKALGAYLQTNSETYSELMLAEMMTTLFAKQISEERTRLNWLINESAASNERSETKIEPLVETGFSDIEFDVPDSIPTEEPTLVAQKPVVSLVRLSAPAPKNFEFENIETPLIRESPGKDKSAPKMPRKMLSICLFLGIAGVFCVFNRRPATVSPENFGVIKLKLSPRQDRYSLVFIDGKPQDLRSTISVELDAPHKILVARDGFEPESKIFSIPSEVKNRELDLALSNRPLNPGFISIRTSSPTPLLISNGHDEWEMNAPIVDFPLPPGNYTITQNDWLWMISKKMHVQVLKTERVLIEEPFVEFPWTDRIKL